MITEAKARFSRYVAGDKTAIPADLLSTCISIALGNSDSPSSDLDALLAVYAKTTSQEHKMAMIASFGAINSLDIIQNRVLGKEIIWNTEIIREQDLFYVLSGVNANTNLLSKVRPMLWQWFKDNFTSIADKFANSMGLYGIFPLSFLISGHIVANCVGSGLGKEYIAEVEAWAAGQGVSQEVKDARLAGLKPVQTKMSQCLEKMKSLTQWCERDRQTVSEWAQAAKI